jgi:hypothetical protein
MIGNYRFALDYGCVHPGMPLCRKQFRRSRDAPIFPAGDEPAGNFGIDLGRSIVKELIELTSGSSVAGLPHGVNYRD